jgi:hypothetical protein
MLHNYLHEFDIYEKLKAEVAALARQEDVSEWNFRLFGCKSYMKAKIGKNHE